MRLAENKQLAANLPIKQKRGTSEDFPVYYLLPIACLMFSVICWLIAANSYAESPQEKHKQVQEDIITQQEKLESAKKAERSVLEDIRKADIELAELKKQLKIQRKKIGGARNNISALQKDINDTEEALQIQSKLLKKRLRALQRHNRDDDIFLILISGEDVSQTIRMLRHISDLSTHDHLIIKRHKDTVKTLGKKQNDIRGSLSNLRLEENKLSKLEKSLEEKRKEREVFLVDTRKEKKSHEKMIRELRETSNRFLRIIREAERREKEIRKRNLREKRDLAIKERLLRDVDFIKLRGKLPWPVSGTVAIRYGRQVDPVFNLPLHRSGIHIKTDRGHSVKAVQSGKVVFADKFEGFGQLVIISHGDGYHTLYGNLFRIFVSNGDIIEKAKIIGEVGESIALGTSGLYFEIRYRGKPLDPQQWLRSK